MAALRENSATENRISISVITPSLNKADYVDRTLESVRRQTYPCLEHIVVDQHSTDGTLEIVRAAPPPVTVVMDAGRGLSRALNVGVSRAAGEVFGWLNADDLYLPQTLERVAATFKASPEAAVVYGDCHFVDAADRILWTESVGEVSRERLLSEASPLAQPAVFVRTRALRDIGPFDESLSLALDLDLWIRLSERHRFAYLAEPLACFRWHPGSQSASRGAQSWAEGFRVRRRYGGKLTWRLAYAYGRFLVTATRHKMLPALRTARDA